MEFGETELKSALYFMFNFNLKTLEDTGWLAMELTGAAYCNGHKRYLVGHLPLRCRCSDLEWWLPRLNWRTTRGLHRKARLRVRPVRPVRPLKRRRLKVNLKVTGLSLGSTLWSHSSVTERTERTEQTNSSRVGTALSWWLWKWDEGPCNLQGWPCTVGLFFSDECAEFALRTRCAKRLNFCGSKTWTVTSWSKGSCWDVTPCPLHCHCPPLSTPLRRPWATPLYWSYFGSSWVKTDSKRLDFWQNYLHWVTELVTVCSTWSYHCNCAARLCV